MNSGVMCEEWCYGVRSGVMMEEVGLLCKEWGYDVRSGVMML